MPLHSKGKRKANDQSRDTKGRYTSKKKYHIAPVIADYDTEVNEFNELNVSDGMWGDDDDSGWDDTENLEDEIKINTKLKDLSLVWTDDNQLKKTKRGPYMTSKIPKSTYYDKYGPNGIFTKAAAGTKKSPASLTLAMLEIHRLNLMK